VEGSKFPTIQNLFEKAGIDPQNVYLEITERSAISNFKKFYQDLHVYREYGFKFAVDDVGGGYASLESIIETRPEVVKIDRHIVHTMSEDALRRGIVKFIVSFCKENNIMSVAEGIETKDDFEVAKQLGVDAGQGFYFHTPAPGFVTQDKIMKNITGL
jgi:EAL domain-containing protein (putative c-di-GMP-specific phosphodiesterase class I)